MRSGKDILLVAIQVFLFFIYLFRLPSIDFSVAVGGHIAGLAGAVSGILVILSAIYTLRKSLSPFPTPKKEGVLTTSGLYMYIRHPIYTGILLFTFGYGLYSENTLRLVISLVLLILFLYKAKYEETLLVRKFPDYQKDRSTTKMFVPGVY